MDDRHFDGVTMMLSAMPSRRGVVSALAGAFLGAATAAVGEDATAHGARAKGKKGRREPNTGGGGVGAEKKHKKKKQHRCLTYGNVSVACPKGTICCDPGLSTKGGCAPAGYPVCCASDAHAHKPGILCCATGDEGSGGVCDTLYPNCCPPSVGGCCEAGFPVCCSNALGEYCCDLGMTCCETSETGCCADGTAPRAPHAGDVTRGVWRRVAGGAATMVSASQQP